MFTWSLEGSKFERARICIQQWLKCDMSLVEEAAKDVLKYVNIVLLCMLMYFCLFFPNN